MRNYCRVYHTSIDYLNKMPISRLISELEDAAEDLAEEQRQREKRMKQEKAKAKAVKHSRPRHRRR
ncbi:MAG: hypothetical protein IJ087_02675 [Eggerthellaceae bacterium]|nr:hypothetical protein [Eggerthellaceae bacterium]